MQHSLIYVTQIERKDLWSLCNGAHHHRHHNIYDFTGLCSTIPYNVVFLRDFFLYETGCQGSHLA